MHPNDVKTTRAIISKYALQEDGNERGAKKHRFDMTSIDPEKRSAAGYIAKYISKNIDNDLYRNDAKPAASKIDAWSSLWGFVNFNKLVVHLLPFGVNSDAYRSLPTQISSKRLGNQPVLENIIPLASPLFDGSIGA
ncbi:MAG: hypothetical protein ACJAXJ_004525 [Colwellia sp.]|jgi:hypothetical protein